MRDSFLREIVRQGERKLQEMDKFTKHAEQKKEWDKSKVFS
jgi:hypothetical protein